MAKTEEPWTQLATRIPKELHRRLKWYCVAHGTSVMDFVTEAITEKLGRKARLKKRPRKRPLAAHPAAAYPNTAFNSRNFASPALAG